MAFDRENLSRPIFKEEQGGITVIIPRERFMAISYRGATDQKTDQKKRIVELICKNPSISRAEIAKQLGIHESSVKRRMVDLISDGIIGHTGPDKGGSWEIRKR